VKYVDATELGDGTFHKRSTVIFLADIGNNAFGFVTFLAQKVTGLLQGRHASICQHQLCALPCEKKRCRPTVADTLALRLPGTRDDGNLSI
jgi:hypothetical protein